MRAYRAGDEFLTWCASAGVPSIVAIQPVHVAGLKIEAAMRELAAPPSSNGLRRCAIELTRRGAPALGRRSCRNQVRRSC